MKEFEDEKELIRREVRSIVDKVLEMGDGDVAFGHDLAVQSVYEISEPIAKMLSDKWASNCTAKRSFGHRISIFAPHNPVVVKSVLSICALPLIHKADHAFVTGRR